MHMNPIYIVSRTKKNPQNPKDRSQEFVHMPTLAPIPVTKNSNSMIRLYWLVRDTISKDKKLSPAEYNGHVGQFIFLLVSFKIFENLVNLSGESRDDQHDRSIICPCELITIESISWNDHSFVICAHLNLKHSLILPDQRCIRIIVLFCPLIIIIVQVFGYICIVKHV